MLIVWNFDSETILEGLFIELAFVRWPVQYCYSCSTCLPKSADAGRCNEVGQLTFWSHHSPIPVDSKPRCLTSKLHPLLMATGAEFKIEHVDTASWLHPKFIKQQGLDHVWVKTIERFWLDEHNEPQVRNWCQMMPVSSTMKNAYRSRKTDDENNFAVPQSFSFMCRQGRVFLHFVSSN